MDALSLIRKPIGRELEEYKKVFDSYLIHSNPILREVLKFIGQRKGKMMRPILTLLSAKLFGDINESSIFTAATFEFTHTASLVHDDVVDESEERRGLPSVNSIYNNKVAVLVGDYILASGLLNAYNAGNSEIVKIVSTAAQKLANGELLQLKNVEYEKISEDVYFEIIKNKTAALFSACAEGGAVSTGASEKDRENMRRFGEIIGICFQIKDDIFDYYDENDIGKPTGNDMQEGKLTLPVIHALFTTVSNEMFDIAYKVKSRNVTHDEIVKLIQFTKENGGIEYAENVMKKYAADANKILDEYEDSDIKDALKAYVDFVIERNK